MASSSLPGQASPGRALAVTRARPGSTTWRRRLAPLPYLLPAAAIYTAFVLWPLAHVLWLSLARWDGYGPTTFVGLANYGTLFGDPGFLTELQHSLVWLCVTLVAPMALGLGLALLLRAVPARLAALCRALLLVPLLLPSAVIAVTWKLIYTPLDGLLNTVLTDIGLGALTQDWLGDPNLALGSLLAAACWAGFGLSVLVFGAALATIGRDAQEAAALDGAGAWSCFRHLTLPHLRHALPLAVVATALSAVPAFDLVALLTNGGPGYATTTLELDMEGRAFGLGQVGVGAALACIAALFGLALSVVALAIARGYEQGSADDVAAWGERTQTRSFQGGQRWLAVPGLLAITAFLLVPVAWLFIRAAQLDYGEASPWANVGTVWSNGFGAAFLTSALIGSVVAVATVALALPAAFLLQRTRGRALRVVVVIGLAIGLFQPIEVLIIPLFTLLQQLQLLNSVPGVMLPEIARGLPLAVLLLWGALRGIPGDLLEAATVDGAAPRQILSRIVLPLAMPMVLVMAVWAFLSSWDEYLLPTMVMQDASLQTVPVALGHFIGRIDTQYALIATGALLAAAPLLLIYVLGYSVFSAGVRRLHLL
jgi:raffinose/stachyose/melibiose transport system permease protein